MKTIPIEVISRTNPLEKRIAQLVICNACEGNTFHIYDIDSHQHIECSTCRDTFCDGQCKEPPSARN